MYKLILRTAVFGVLLVSLAALPAMSQQVIPAGNDYWVTPPNGQTYLTLAAGDLEGLCGAVPSDLWDHRVVFQGVRTAAADYDTVVRRLENAVFDAAGVARTRVQLAHLAFSGVSVGTPCGDIHWSVGLAGPQRVTQMVIRRTSPRGGIFNAQLAVDVELRAHDASGNYLGSLFYSFDLPDPSTGTGSGTPWSFGLTGQFRAGMTELDNCIDILRKKLKLYSPDSSHWYYISDLIAQGKCGERPN
ncbi:MAG TPA: hypothetical protein VG477_02115 [Thermoanaerobaculia bacterium]|nr:hypothetical protein [Thermoanaerobaculia bacterium]